MARNDPRIIETKYIMSGRTPAQDVEVQTTRSTQPGRSVARLRGEYGE